MVLLLLLLSASLGTTGFYPALDLSGAPELGVPMELSLRGRLSDRLAVQAPASGGKSSSVFPPTVTKPGEAVVDTASRVSTACLLGSLLPGAGHAASDTYLYRGLAFTLAFLLTTAGGASFLALEEDGLGGRYALTGGWALMLGAQVIYVWSLVDAITLASSPEGRRR